jgi:hypothetical protein
MKPQPKIYEDATAEFRLKQLGLASDLLIQSVLVGEYYRDTCTDNDANCAPGMFAYSRTARKLRELLRPFGWERSDYQNRAIVLSPDRTMSISPESGDEGTGIASMFPNTKGPKGDATKKAVDPNQRSLFEGIYPTVAEVYEPTDTHSWFLLRRRTETAVYIELSLPAKIVDCRVEWWVERIILGRIPYEPVYNAGEDFETDQIEIPISRRQA